jgi:hypothetical protein
MKKVILVFLILQIVGYSSLMTMQKSHAEQLDFLSAALPSQIGLWTAESKDRMYDRETIFSYIDGAGEVYRASAFSPTTGTEELWTWGREPFTVRAG